MQDYRAKRSGLSMKIPRAVVASLRSHGLLVTEIFGPSHEAFPDGAAIAKPASAGGNRIAECAAPREGDGVVIDAPSVVLHECDGTWVVTATEWVPGPGPGDFTTRWSTAEAAVLDILDFYFGDPARMRAKATRPVAER
jgi:hypothetical protein